MGGDTKLPSPAEVRQGLEAGLASRKRQPGAQIEAAFYGGTFTNLPRSDQGKLLDAVSPFIKSGRIQGIRLSTRPDALSQDRIDFLLGHGVTTVEIGAQSMDDRVLAAGRRGHTAAQTREAACRVKAAGLRLGLQLLLGLPKEDEASRKKTLEEVLDLAPDEARLYPLLVIKGTRLAEHFEAGRYQPLGLTEAVRACASMLVKLEAKGVTVIRVGLQTGPELEANLLAGPYHPAFGHLVKSEVFAQSLTQILTARPAGDETVIHVAPGELSQALGQNRDNIARLSTDFNLNDLQIKPDPELAKGCFRWQGQVYSILDNLTFRPGAGRTGAQYDQSSPC